MFIDIRKFFTGNEAPVDTELCFELANEDFPSYRINKPVNVKLRVFLENDRMQIFINLTAVVEAECARCTQPLETTLNFENKYAFRIDELICDNPELPVTSDKKLDIRELVYTELVLEVPSVLLCSQTCEGLCPICGAGKEQGCSCKTRAVDDRLAVLEKLLS